MTRRIFEFGILIQYKTIQSFRCAKIKTKFQKSFLQCLDWQPNDIFNGALDRLNDLVAPGLDTVCACLIERVYMLEVSVNRCIIKMLEVHLISCS